MRTRRCGLVLGTTAALVLSAAAGAASAAAFGDAAASSSSFSAATLQPVTNVARSTECQSGLLGLLGQSPVIHVGWTRSAQISSGTSSLRGHTLRVIVGGTTYDAVTSPTTVTGAMSTADVIGKTPLGGGVPTALAQGASHQVQVFSQWGQWLSVAATPAAGAITTPSGLGCL